MPTGRIKTWNGASGYGFIEPDDGGPDAFCHVTAIAEQTWQPAVGDAVAYEMGTNPRNGRACAVQVRHGGDHPEDEPAVSAPTA